MKTIFKGAAFLLTATIFASGAMAQSAGWQKVWNDTLAAAKTEGKVVVAGSPDPVMRDKIIPTFTKRYGISVDFIAGHSSQIAARVKAERLAGIYSMDVYMAGAGTTVLTLYQGKMIDALKPMLIRPEVTDPSHWKGGKLPFADKENQYIFLAFNRVDSLMFINTDYVKKDEIKNYHDLLQPKWKGKIATEDPRAHGRGISRSAQLYSQFGADFIKKLYIDQKPAITDDRRQLTDWLARGTYPVCLTCRTDDAEKLIKEGFHLYEVYDLKDTKNLLNAAPFLLTVADKAPHPNATRIFVNWLLSKEGLEIYSRGYGAPTTRTDVDESFLDPRVIPKPDGNYQDETDIKWLTKGRKAAENAVKALLKGM
jgi:iron(III) transport system substrate-binding protein